MGSLHIDTATREVVVRAEINADVQVIEFVANTPNGIKAYESALTIDADAVSLNAALLLIGLDPSRARVPTRQFDPEEPKGDPVEIHVAWKKTAKGKDRRARIEELLFDRRTNETIPLSPWVYTGSTFIEQFDGRRIFLAESDGVLIGLMHGPQALIENASSVAVEGFGAIVLNKELIDQHGTAVTVTIKALPRPSPQVP